MNLCIACPFNDTVDSIQGQNWGCLPDPDYMILTVRDRGIALSCHDNEKIPCRGLSSFIKTTDATILSYTDWYQKGFEQT